MSNMMNEDASNAEQEPTSGSSNTHAGIDNIGKGLAHSADISHY